MNNNDITPLLAEMAIFVTVSEELNFSKAGKKLGLSTSTVSRSVHRLEQALQAKLLERTTRNVRLSSTGQLVYEQCKLMVTTAKMAVQAANTDHDEPSGQLRIAAPKAFSKIILSEKVLDFLQLYPKVNVKFKVSDGLLSFIDEEIDVLFMLTENPIEGLVSKKLMRSNLVMCATPTYLQQHGTPEHPDDLHDHLCITLGEHDGDALWRMDSKTDQVAIKTNPHFSVNHTELRRDAVLRHMGISVFPDFAIQSAINSGEVVAVLPDWHVSGNYQGQVIMQYAHSRFIPSQLRAFIDFMVNSFVPKERDTHQPDKSYS